MKKFFTLMTIVISLAVISCKQVESELESENDIIETKVSDSLILVKNLNSLIDEDGILEKIEKATLKGFKLDVHYIDEQKYLHYTLEEDNYNFDINTKSLILSEGEEISEFEILEDILDDFIFILKIGSDKFGIDKIGEIYKIYNDNSYELVFQFISTENGGYTKIAEIEEDNFDDYIRLITWRNTVYNTDLAYVINE